MRLTALQSVDKGLELVAISVKVTRQVETPLLVGEHLRCPPELPQTRILKRVRLLHTFLTAGGPHFDTMEQVRKSESIVVDLAALELNSNGVLWYVWKKTEWTPTWLLDVRERVGRGIVGEVVGGRHSAVVLGIA